MALLTLKGNGDLEEIVKYLEVKIADSGISSQLVHKVKRSLYGSNVYLLAFEKYYFRNESRTSLSILITENDDEITVDAVSTGGGQGLIFRISWGAEENYVNVVRDALLSKGFRTLI
jgi:NAD kinase